MTWLEQAVGLAGDVLVLVLMVSGAAAVLWVMWVAIRVGQRRQLIVADLANLTGYSGLDVDAAWMTQLMRGSLLREFRSVSDRAAFLLHRAKIEPGQGELAPPQRDIEVSLRDLAASVTAVASERTRPAAQLLAEVLLRPAGIRIRGSLLCYTKRSRLGVGFEIVDLRGNQRPATFSLKSGPNSAMATAVNETAATTLVNAATRVLAVELLRLDLLRRQRRRSWRGDRNPGVVTRFIGLIYQASAPAFPDFETDMYGHAINALREAVVRLPRDYHPLKDLGDTEDYLRRCDNEQSTRHAAAALNYYDRAEEVALAHKAGRTALIAVQVSRGIARFHLDSSSLDGHKQALRLLAELESREWDPDKEEDEHLLYNGACLLSMELSRSTGKPAEQALADRAKELLGYALLRDRSPDRNLIGGVTRENDLAALRTFVDLDELVQHYRDWQLKLAENHRATMRHAVNDCPSLDHEPVLEDPDRDR